VEGGLGYRLTGKHARVEICLLYTYVPRVKIHEHVIPKISGLICQAMDNIGLV
jgi:hypothetical protein